MIPGFIDTKALFDTVAAAFVAGVGITFVFAVALYGVARFGELDRAGRGGSAALYAGLAALGGLAFVAAIVVGLIVMASK